MPLVLANVAVSSRRIAHARNGRASAKQALASPVAARHTLASRALLKHEMPVTGKRIFAPLCFFDHAVALHFRTARQASPEWHHDPPFQRPPSQLVAKACIAASRVGAR